MSNSSLGRGLGSLIPDKKFIKTQTVDASKAEKNSIGKALEVDINKISANPKQPRTHFNEQRINDLAMSIKEHGVIQPLIVARKGDNYELIAGERRLRASKEAGLSKVPVIIREVNEQTKLELALIENIQREDLNPVELAVAYKQLIDEFSLSQEAIAKQVGKSRSSVTNILRMLILPDEIKESLEQSKITEGHAKYLLGLNNEKQMMVYRKIVNNKLTVQDTDKVIKQMGGTKKARVKINYRDKDKEFALREFFGAKINITRKGRGGQIIIDFFSDDELEEIIDKIR
ncbi:MAG: ParB/RepB/Spo0J family partition protein [Patescibacteria group bacterium]|nr:ParB/RepB/Spo0J family partition protein [Patescibacteria group bacterium]